MLCLASPRFTQWNKTLSILNWIRLLLYILKWRYSIKNHRSVEWFGLENNSWRKMKWEVEIRYQELLLLFFLFFPCWFDSLHANPHLNRVMHHWAGRGATLSLAAQNAGASRFFWRSCVASEFFRQPLRGFVLPRRWVHGPAARMQSVFVLIRILNYNRAQSSEVPLHYCWTKKSLSSDRREVWMMDNGSLRCSAIITLLPMRQQLF